MNGLQTVSHIIFLGDLNRIKRSLLMFISLRLKKEDNLEIKNESEKINYQLNDPFNALH